MSAEKRFHVHAFGSYGYIHRARINGEWVELSRKEPDPPIATITARDLNTAHAEAVRRFGRSVFTSEVGGVMTATSFTGTAQAKVAS